MLGLDEARIFKNITFKNCYYNGKWLGSFEDGGFLVNKYVENIKFLLDSLKHQVSLSVNNEPGGSVSGGEIYSHGETITVSAHAVKGYSFAGWTINNDTVSVNPQYTFDVTLDKQLMANFFLSTAAGKGLKNSIKIYPNPATDKLNFNFTGQDLNKIQLIDLTGKVVYTGIALNQNESIDLSMFKRGFYIVQIHTSDNIITTKVMIK
jgi:hypothetical protein